MARTLPCRVGLDAPHASLCFPPQPSLQQYVAASCVASSCCSPAHADPLLPAISDYDPRSSRPPHSELRLVASRSAARPLPLPPMVPCWSVHHYRLFALTADLLNTVQLPRCKPPNRIARILARSLLTLGFSASTPPCAFEFNVSVSQYPTLRHQLPRLCYSRQSPARV